MRPLARAVAGGMITSSGSTPSRSRSSSRTRCRRGEASHHVQHVAERLAGRRSAPTDRAGRGRAGAASPRARRRRGTRGRSGAGPFGSESTRRGTRRLTSSQSSTVGRAQAGRVRDGRDVQEQIGRAAEGGVDDHRVADGGVGHDVPHRLLAGAEGQHAAGRAAGHVEPDGLSRRGQRAVQHRRARALRRRPARSPRCRGTGSRRPARRRRGSPSPPLPRARSSRARSGRRASGPCRRPRRRSAGSVTPPGTITPGRSCAPASAIIIAGSPLSQVADADDADPRRQRSNQPAAAPSPRRCDTAASPSCRSCPACGRRTGR